VRGAAPTPWPAAGASIATAGGVVSRSTVTLALAIPPVSLRAPAVRVFLPSRSGTPSAVKPPASSTASTPFTCTATAVAETAPVTRTLPWLVRKPLAGVAISTVTGAQSRPSSTWPLQSLSMPSQTSGLGAPGVHAWGTPPTQLSTVRAQAPTPQVVRPRPSSTWPLQSLSMPSPASGLGGPGVHAWGTPPTQLSTVRVQAPTPQVVRPRPSSTCPLQSLSMPSQTSGLGVPGVHGWGTPPTQLSTVRVQAPTPQVVRPRPSSTWPLQSLSMPSQTSGLGVQPCRLQSSLQPGPGGSHASPLSTTSSPQRGRVHVVRHASGVVSLFRSPSSQASFPSTVPLPHTAITRPGGNVNSVLWSLWPTVKRRVCAPRSSPIPKRMVIGFAVPVRSTCWAMTSKVHFTSPAPLVARTISTSLT